MKTIAIDFDGVIHKYSKGWHDGSCYDEPMSNSEYALKRLMREYHDASIFIFTTRDCGQVKNWFDKYFKFSTQIIPDDVQFWNTKGVIGITNKKLPAVMYIDDRAVKFTRWTEEFIELLEKEISPKS